MSTTDLATTSGQEATDTLAAALDGHSYDDHGAAYLPIRGVGWHSTRYPVRVVTGKDCDGIKSALVRLRERRAAAATAVSA